MKARRELEPWELHCLRLDRYDDDPPPPGWPTSLDRVIELPMRATSEVSARPKEIRTAGQKARFRRNLVIAAAHRQGCSLRLLAEVFGLPRSHISEIIREIEATRPRPHNDPRKGH